MLGIIGNGAYAPLDYFFVALAIAAFGVETWAFIDAIIRPAQAYVAAGKQTKPIWLIILGVAFVLGLYAAAYGGVEHPAVGRFSLHATSRIGMHVDCAVVADRGDGMAALLKDGIGGGCSP